MAKKNDKKTEEERTERGLESMLRTASRNHMQLSSMADNKAHILLNINSIIITIVLSVLAHRLIAEHYLIIPTAILLLTCLASIVFAILSTRPRIGKGRFTQEQVDNNQTNLLFFGNFHHMELDAYHEGINEMITDKQYLKKSMTTDIYFLGKALALKYRYLNFGYRVFMFGLVTSVFAFMASLFYAYESHQLLY